MTFTKSQLFCEGVSVKARGEGGGEDDSERCHYTLTSTCVFVSLKLRSQGVITADAEHLAVRSARDHHVCLYAAACYLESIFHTGTVLCVRPRVSPCSLSPFGANSLLPFIIPALVLRN